MIYKSQAFVKLCIVSSAVLLSLFPVKADAALKTVPIVVQFEIESEILSDWQNDPNKHLEGESVHKEILSTFTQSIREYLSEWWDITMDHRMRTNLTIQLILEEGGWQEYFYRVFLLVEREWGDGSTTVERTQLAEKSWEDPTGLKPDTSPKSVKEAFTRFLNTEFPNERKIKKARFLEVIEYAPVAVGAELVQNQKDLLYLPFPNTQRYMCYKERFFQLKSRERYSGALSCTVESTRNWSICPQHSTEALLVEAVVPDLLSFDPNPYDQAFIYLWLDDPLWENL